MIQVYGIRIRHVCTCLCAGYWDENENLDRELSLFVAGMWACLQSPGSDEPYFYNQVRYTACSTNCAAEFAQVEQLML